jgi:hypothetical protein
MLLVSFWGDRFRRERAAARDRPYRRGLKGTMCGVAPESDRKGREGASPSSTLRCGDVPRAMSRCRCDVGAGLAPAYGFTPSLAVAWEPRRTSCRCGRPETTAQIVLLSSRLWGSLLRPPFEPLACIAYFSRTFLASELDC